MEGLTQISNESLKGSATLIVQVELAQMEDEFMEKLPVPPEFDPKWTADGPNILAEENLGCIGRVLADDWICGIPMFLGCGGSPDPVAFSNYDAFLSHVIGSRPGDLFVLWSVSEMRKKGLLLVDNRYDDATSARGSLLSQGDIECVRVYLAEEKLNEVIVVVSEGDGHPEVFWADFESSMWEPFLEAAKRAAVPGGAIRVLPLTKTDNAEHYLAKAKRPNSEGKVLVGGAY